MPHALFLGAKLGTIRRIEEDHDDVDNESKESKVETGRTSPQLSEGPVSIPISPRLSLSHGAQPRARSTTINQLHSPSLHMPYSMPMPRYPLEDTTKTERSARFIRIHLHHAQIDIAYSLVCFALVTNSAILTVAGAAFYYRDGNEDTSGVQEGDLFSAHALIKSRVGTGEQTYTSRTFFPAPCDILLMVESFCSIRFSLCSCVDDEWASSLYYSNTRWPSGI